MRIWVFLMLTILSGCRLFKEKNRLEVDSLAVEKSSGRLELRQGGWSSEIGFTEKGVIKQLLIEADAPFKWQVDSGLTGGAGKYRFFIVQKDKSLTGKVALTQQELVEKKEENKRESWKYRIMEKNISPAFFNWKVFFWMGLLLFLGFWYLRWKI